MARRRQTVTQRSFALGELIDSFLEGDDLEARRASVRSCTNIRVTSARTAKARPGTLYRASVPTAEDVVEIRPANDVVFGLVVKDNALDIINSSGVVVQSFGSVPWVDASDVWIEPFRERTILGGSTFLYVLTYSGSWSLTAFSFQTVAGGELAQPYWPYRTDVTIRPSAVTGAITLTASAALWSASYVGQRVRYGGREIQVTGYTSATVVSGTVISRLPPSFDITVTSAASFRVGDAVVGQDTNFQGLIVAIAGNVLSVVTIEFFDGPDVGEELSGPTGSSDVTVKASISPLTSPIWDEPLMSPLRGYPRAGSSANGRLALANFEGIPDLICLSSARDITDFEIGADDDDGILRQCGENAPRFLHVINAGDLLLFSDRGLYYVPLRDKGILTPSTFAAVAFDNRAANEVRPVRVDDGVVFVEGSGQTVSAALLDGNIYLKWSVRPISNFHAHLIKTPKKLCGPPIYSNSPDKYLFVVNTDGSIAAVSWLQDFGQENVGFVPWQTNGTFINVAPVFGGYWAIVDRVVGGAIVRHLEEFSDAAYLDSQATFMPGYLSHLPGLKVHIWNSGWYGGEIDVSSAGALVDNGNLLSGSEVGLNFEVSLSPWPVENIESERAGLLRARLIEVGVSVLDTLSFQCRTNRTTRTIEAYGVGDDTSVPPPLKTNIFRFSVIGNRDHPETEIIKHLPGPFHVLAITQEVQV